MQILELFGSTPLLTMFSSIILGGLIILVLSIINLASRGRLFQKIWPHAPTTPAEQKAFASLVLIFECFASLFYIIILEDAFGNDKLFWPATTMTFLLIVMYILIEILFERQN